MGLCASGTAKAAPSSAKKTSSNTRQSVGGKKDMRKEAKLVLLGMPQYA